MEEILELKNKIQRGENLGDNYELLLKNVNNRLNTLKIIETKIKKNTTKKLECHNINDIEIHIDELIKKNYIDDKYLDTYKIILSKINYLDDYYNSNITNIKKICEQNKKVVLKKINNKTS